MDTSSKNYNNNTDIQNFKVKYYNNYNNNSKVFKNEDKNKNNNFNIINPENINNYDKSNVIYNSYKSNNADTFSNKDSSSNQNFRFSVKENDISKEKITIDNKDLSDILNYNNISTEKTIFNKKPINFNDNQLINKNENRHNIDYKEFTKKIKYSNSYIITIKNSYKLNNKEIKFLYKNHNNHRNSIKKEI